MICKKLEESEQRDGKSIHPSRSNPKTESMNATASQGTESKKTAREGKPHYPRRQNCDEKRKVDHQ